MSYEIPNNNVTPIVIPTVTPTIDGVMSSAMLALLLGAAGGSVTVYSIAGIGAPIRPPANAVGAVPGVSVVQIWNISDKAPNFSDGVNWYDAMGNLT